RRALGLARREPPRAYGDPRPLRERQARDGRNRLVPAGREGDPGSRWATRARGDHPGARAPGALAPCGRRGRGAARPARESRRLRRRRRVAHDAPYRWSVSELPPAFAGAVRARTAAPPGGPPRRRPARLADGAAKLAAAAAVRRGRVDG